MPERKAERVAPAGLSVLTASRRTLDLDAHIVRSRAEHVDYDRVTRMQRWDVVHGLVAAMNAGPTGVGIAAPMVGVGLRAVVVTAGAEPLAMFNPEVVATSGPERTEDEGNLCLPGVRAPVTRPSEATIRWQSVNSGQYKTETFRGWEARVLLHEIEVLDGRMFIDDASKPPVGTWRPIDDLAGRSVAGLFGEGSPTRRLRDPLSLAVLRPKLLSLDGVLNRPAANVDLDGLGREHLRAIVESMLHVQYQHRGVGLAAPQVGLGLRLIVIDIGDGPPVVLINPRITDRNDEQEVALEGCLSLPGWRGPVSRSTAVKVATETVDGATVDLEFAGFAARVAQHEIDHVDGLLYTGRMDPEAELTPTDPDAVAAELVRRMQATEAAESRRTADAHRSSAASRPKKRRR